MLIKKLFALVTLALYQTAPGGGTPGAALAAPPAPAPGSELATPTPTPAPVAAPIGVPPAPGAADAWYKDFKDEGVKGWLTAYAGAYPNAEEVAKKAYNLEKFMGVEKAGRGVVVPKPDDKPEVWREFWNKVGAPAKADAYALPPTIKPEMATELNKDPMFVKFREKAHAAGMTQQHFGAVTDWYVNEMGAAEATRIAEFNRQGETDVEALKKEWGNDHPKNVELARRAVKQFAPHKSQEELDEFTNKMMGAIGVGATYRMFAAIGKGFEEDNFVLGGGTGGPGGRTRESALAEIEALKKDKEFGAKLANGDATARQKWDELHKIATGGQ